MRIFLTGAAGFIGSHLSERLLSRGHEVVGLDNFDPFYDPAIKERNIAALAPNKSFKLYRGDILDARIVAEAISGCELVVHVAALAGVRPSLKAPLRYHRVNVDGTLGLLEACKQSDVKRFVFASSSSVYGERDTTPFREDDPCDTPSSPYAATKRAAEHYLRSYTHCYGMDVTTLRFFTVYGPRQRPEMAIHKFARMIDAGEPIPLFGDGHSARDYTYIDDIIQGATKAVETPARGYRVYNLGESQTTRLHQLVSMLERALDKKAKIDRQPNQLGDVPITFADVTAARRDLGYDPQVPLADGIERFVRWFRDRHN